MDPFHSVRRSLRLSSGREIDFYSLPDLARELGFDIDRLPFSLRVLLESLVRRQDHPAYRPDHVESLARWTPGTDARDELPFLPSRVLLQDFTGVPCVVDLAALRSALRRAGGDPAAIVPLVPVDLVIDHSVQLDRTGSAEALAANLEKEFERNGERYRFLRWGRNAFGKLRVLPPGLGICHQVNMEYLASCVGTTQGPGGRETAFPDTLVGTDSHTVMINSMGVLGWGVGGIEAEAAMLGQPIPVLTPAVVGVRLTGRLAGEATPTDLALTVTQRLRELGVVGRFVEFFGPGLDALPLVDRAPVANMAPEYGATTGFFPIDAATMAYLRDTGRDAEQVELVEAYARAQRLWRGDAGEEIAFSETVKIDLADVEPSVAGPRRPQDRLPLDLVGKRFREALTAPVAKKGFGVPAGRAEAKAPLPGGEALAHGAVVIASITSCTNTSNPSLLVGAALLARNAARRGLRIPPWVRTSFAPGSRAVRRYLGRTGLLRDLEALGFHVAAYGCATCIGNSGPLDPAIERAIREGDLVAAAVLSGNRNFEGRIHPLTRANYLCSPPLVVAYALKGTVRGRLAEDPLGTDPEGRPVYLHDLWPAPGELAEAARAAADPEAYREAYRDTDAFNPLWQQLPSEEGAVYAWDAASTYIREPTFFEDFRPEPQAMADIEQARALGFYGDFITTDHISPAGAIPPDGPAAAYLRACGVAPEDFNSFGARRGNHEVMVRGTFANIRMRNRLADREGGWTVHLPTGEAVSIHEAAQRYRSEGTPLVVLAGKMYGAGSSRDWAAKGTALLGVRAVLAESFERIHRSNLVEMGVLPLEFAEGASAERLGLTGRECFTIRGLAGGLQPHARVSVTAESEEAAPVHFEALVRIDTPIEAEYVRHGGILPYVLRGFLAHT